MTVALMGAACNSARSTCQQRKECLSGHDSCDDCAKDNYVDVCSAENDANIIRYTSCDDDKCRDAADYVDQYLDCLAAAECTEWLRSVDKDQDFTLCEAELNRMNDATKACREAKKHSCDF